MNNDLISREDLKKALHNFFDGKVIDEPAYILRDVFCYIDNAPTVELPDFKEGYKQAILDGKTQYQRPQGEYVDISKLRLMTVEECAGHTLDYAMGWKACVEWIKKGGAK